jgi:hypothetical protein
MVQQRVDVILVKPLQRKRRKEKRQDTQWGGQ